jgi:HK97 family phage major capsid protein
LNESTPSEGGFLVAPGVTTAAVFEKANEVSQLLSRVTRMPMDKSNRLSLPAVSEQSRANGSRYGSMALAWGPEGGTMPDTKPKFGQLTFTSNKLGGVMYLTDELFGSTAGGAVFEKLAGTELGFTLEDGIINGTGTGQLLGVLNAACTIEVAPTSGEASATVTGQNLTDMVARFWAGSYNAGVWLMGVPAFSQVSAASFSNGAPCVTYGADGRRYSLGFEILVTEYCSAVGSRGDVILMDPREYIFSERESGVIGSLEVKFLSDEAAVKIRFRGDAMPGWTSAVTPKDGGPTQSMAVVLGTR